MGQHHQQHADNLRKRVETLAQAGLPGALFSMEIEHQGLEWSRSQGIAREYEEEILLQAWQTALAILPPSSVGLRTSWSRIEFVVAGQKDALVSFGRRILVALKNLCAFDWHLVFVEILNAEAQSTLRCDPGYDLREVEGRSSIAWVQPYSGSDWQESQRYPTVSFLPLEQQDLW